MNRKCRGEKINNPDAYFIKTRHDVAQVDPWRPCVSHLVEQVISEELQQVPIPGLRPRRILLESASFQKDGFPRHKNPQQPTGTNRIHGSSTFPSTPETSSLHTTTNGGEYRKTCLGFFRVNTRFRNSTFSLTITTKKKKKKHFLCWLQRWCNINPTDFNHSFWRCCTGEMKRHVYLMDLLLQVLLHIFMCAHLQ